MVRVPFNLSFSKSKRNLLGGRALYSRAEDESLWLSLWTHSRTHKILFCWIFIGFLLRIFQSVVLRNVRIVIVLLRLFWWARQDSNLRPIHYECTALTSWATGPSCCIATLFIFFILKIYLKVLSYVFKYNSNTTLAKNELTIPRFYTNIS